MSRYNLKDYLGQYPSETAALQACFNDIQGDTFALIDGEDATIKTTETVYYPIGTGAPEIKLQNLRIFAEGDHDILAPDPKLKGMAIAYGSDDNNAIKYLHKFDCERVWFKGGRNQLVLAVQRGSVIRNCNFLQGVRGVLAVFVQHGIIDNCRFQFHDVESAAIRTGVSDGTLMDEWGVTPDENNGDWFSNATTSNSQSNRFTVRDSWFFSKPGQITQVRVQGSDGVTLYNNIHEGAPAKWAIYADSRNSTTTHTINIEKPHIEQGGAATESLIYTREYKNVYIDKLYSQIPGVKVLHVDGNIGQVVMDNLEFIPWDNESFYSHPQVKWIFREPVQDISNAASWDRWEGSMPKEVFYQRDVDIYSLGTQGISLRSDTFINGRKQRCYMLMHGHSVTWRGINYWSRPTNFTVFKKSNLNDL